MRFQGSGFLALCSITGLRSDTRPILIHAGRKVLVTAPAYVFPAVVDEVIDGDTIVATATIAKAFHETWQTQRVWRLNGCNAREKNDPTGGGAAAKAHLITLLPVGTPITLTSIKVDPYTDSKYESARYEATVTLLGGADLVDLLIATGWAAAWDGKSQPRPLPPWPRTR